MQQWFPGLEPQQINCGNHACNRTFDPDPRQPAKRFCCERCRTIHNNALIAQRAGRKKKDWHTIEALSMDEERWQELACFAGGNAQGARVYVEQYRRAVNTKTVQEEDSD